MTTPQSFGYTNPFQVKDLAEFTRTLGPYGGVDVYVQDPNQGIVYLGSDDCFDVRLPDSEDPEDLAELISPHLQEDAVVTFKWMSVERTSILGGVIAINAQGETYSQTIDGLVNDAHATLGLVPEESIAGMMAKV